MIEKLLFEGARERKQLDRIRGEIADVDQELEALAAANYPVDESIDRVMRRTDESAELARTQLGYFTRPGDFPDLPDSSIGLLAVLLGRDEVRDLLRTRITELTPAPGLSTDERTQAISDLATSRRELELKEEREICRLEAKGCVVDRRDIDPEILLEVWDQLDP